MHRCVSIPYISRCRLYRRVRRACGTPGFACCTCRIRHVPRWQARLISRYVGDNVARRFHRSARESGNHDDCRRLLRHAHRFRAFARTPLTDSLPSDLIDMPFVTIDGQPLHYQIRGAGAPVLFGHSYLWDSSMWEPQLDALSKSYRVIAPDLWGHGRSGPLPDGTRSLDDLARQMSELLDHLDIDTCSIVGLSVGGMWAVPLAHRAPQRIDRLVLMDTYVGVEPDATRNQYFQMLEAIDAQGAIPAPLLDAIVPIFFRPGIDPASELPTGFRRALQAFTTERLRDSVIPLGKITFGREDARAQLSALPADRTLVMCGANDVARPPEEADEIAALIGCEKAFVPNAGHISNLENPAFVTQALSDWLGRGAARA
ncbi:3-oxoadipate enol-lactone hydrolase family protein [Burkholderia pseudomallei 1710b]|nr:3-oxoadipate enol-lactone hydrolase family protein [Burkholderia pseudomallei 1710b]